jgi:hypothetical protein
MIFARLPALRHALAAAAIPLTFTLAGCPNDPSPPSDAGADARVDAPGCMLAYVGDKAADIEMEVLILGTGSASSKVSEGSMVPLIFPPQGGEVIFAGVRAKNLDPCGVKITGALRDLDSNLVQVDARTVNLDDPGDGWARSTDSDIASFANISVVPEQLVEDQHLRHRVRARGDGDRPRQAQSATVTLRVDALLRGGGLHVLLHLHLQRRLRARREPATEQATQAEARAPEGTHP